MQALEPLIERARARLGFDIAGEAARVVAISDFVARFAARHGGWFQAFAAARRYEQPADPAYIAGVVTAEATAAKNPDDLKTRLRRIRNEVMVHVVWRHVTGRSSLEETVSGCTSLADACIDQALARLHGWAVESSGQPCNDRGEPQHLLVVALGKLGARELNLSSDVDLMFVYPEPGETPGGRTCQQFFGSLGQRLIEVLDAVTADGFVFRVDMRLRPYGASGPLVMHFEAVEAYYETEGRDWERYALIKARICAGDRARGGRLLQALKPFVFRRYLDFGAIQALRDMHRRMLSERSGPEYQDDVKLGPGGIRDVEFVVQMLQIVWGGRNPGLQTPGLLDVVPRLVADGRLGAADADALTTGYTFLRNVEHSLQALDDQQTQTLPQDAEDRLRVAVSLGYQSWSACAADLDLHRGRIGAIFHHHLDQEQAHTRTGGGQIGDLWTDPPDDDGVLAAGFRQPDIVREHLARLRRAVERPEVGQEGRDRLSHLMAPLLESIGRLEHPETGLARVLPVLMAVLRRSAYLVLLLENDRARERFVSLTSRSKWLTDQLARHPILLDALLDDRLLTDVPDSEPLRASLEEELELFAGDEERQLDALREFKLFHGFSVATAEVSGTLPLMRVSDYLTHVAEAVLSACLNLAWRQTSDKFADAPPRRSDRGAPPFLIVGYGKLGGIELGHGSDLDVVFLHDLPGTANPFLQRLVRRLLHLLTIHTHLGPLYDIDVRLRPSGNAGPMTSSMEAFEKYQSNNAWVWEHQALVRARAVAGDPALAVEFGALRRKVLCQARDRAEVRAEVLKMRQRLVAHHRAEDDLKQGSGGIVDIEFMVQYLVLAWAHDHRRLADYSDNIRILEAVGDAGLLPRDEAEGLIDAYQGLRSEWHRATLDIPDEARQIQVLARYRDTVRASWERVFGSRDV